MRKSKKSVVVLEVHRKAALPVLESMSKGGFHVIGCAPKKLNSGFFSRYCHERIVSPSPVSNPKEFKDWLLGFLTSRRIDMLFPVGGGALPVSEIQDDVRKSTLLLTPPHHIFLEGYEKISTLKAAQSAGVPIPTTWYPHDDDSCIEAVASEIRRWPVLVKPSVGSGARGIVWCYTREQLIQRFKEVEQEHGESLVQDFVPPGRFQYKVDMLVDGHQKLIGEVVYGKTRWYPPMGGSSVLTFSADRPDILALAHRTLVQLNWTGFCDFDFVDDPRDGIPKLIEINPRLPESFRMGTAVGIDFPMMMYRIASGEIVDPVLEYPFNQFLRFLPADLLWFLRVDSSQRFRTWPSWFKFGGKDMTYQLSSWSDPGPGIGYALENIVMMFGRGFWKDRLRANSGPANEEACT
jgi:biotin carboxylase